MTTDSKTSFFGMDHQNSGNGTEYTLKISQKKWKNMIEKA